MTFHKYNSMICMNLEFFICELEVENTIEKRQQFRKKLTERIATKRHAMKRK